MSANDRQVGGNHYKGKKFQPWDWDRYGIGSLEMEVMHYVTRQKGGKQDLEKSLHYVEKLKEEYFEYGRRNRVPVAFKGALAKPMERYCDEWNMSQCQRSVIAYLLSWSNEYDLEDLQEAIESLIAYAYPTTDVCSPGGVEGPESH